MNGTGEEFERTRVNRIRGIVMVLAAAVAFWKGWQIHRGETAILAYGLGALALALGVWHLTLKPPALRARVPRDEG
jgi:membrane protein YdbS with pleckstrin-like domain